MAADEPKSWRRTASSIRFWVGVGISVMVGGLLVACGQTARPAIQVDQALQDPRPSERVAGVAVVGRGCDRTRVPMLIDMLDDPDPAVRLTAGATLRDLTGHDTGYQPWADVSERRMQVQAWRRWWVGETPRPIVAAPVRPAALPAPARPASPPGTVPRTQTPAPPLGARSGAPAPSIADGELPPPVIRVVRGPS